MCEDVEEIVRKKRESVMLFRRRATKARKLLSSINNKFLNEKIPKRQFRLAFWKMKLATTLFKRADELGALVGFGDPQVLAAKRFATRTVLNK
jgi:hypothetical protein